MAEREETGSNFVVVDRLLGVAINLITPPNYTTMCMVISNISWFGILCG
jgi:hypothetical protein